MQTWRAMKMQGGALFFLADSIAKGSVVIPASLQN